MAWIIGLVLASIVMAFCNKQWGNPLAFIGFAYLAFCGWLMAGVALKAIGLT